MYIVRALIDFDSPSVNADTVCLIYLLFKKINGRIKKTNKCNTYIMYKKYMYEGKKNVK